MTIGALFDLDGVVVDSETIYTQVWNDIDKIYPSGIENFAYIIKRNTLEKILGTYYQDKDIQEKIIQIIKDSEKEMKYIPFDEAIRFITELKEAGIKCAMVTSSSQRKVDHLYEQNPFFKDLFDAVITGDVVTHSKPNPEPFILGAKVLGIDPKDCIVFEDSLSGIQAGKAAGSTVVGLATTLKFEDINGKAHKTINDFTGFHLSDVLSAMNISRL